MKRGAPGPAGWLAAAAQSCTVLCTAHCAALHCTLVTIALRGTSPPPSLSGCAPVVGPRAGAAAGGKRVRASFESSAGWVATVPGEEETVNRKRRRRRGRREGREERLACGRSKETVVTGGGCCCSESGGRGKCVREQHSEGHEDQHDVKSMPGGGRRPP